MSLSRVEQECQPFPNHRPAPPLTGGGREGVNPSCPKTTAPLIPPHKEGGDDCEGRAPEPPSHQPSLPPLDGEGMRVGCRAPQADVQPPPTPRPTCAHPNT